MKEKILPHFYENKCSKVVKKKKKMYGTKNIDQRKKFKAKKKKNSTQNTSNTFIAILY